MSRATLLAWIKRSSSGRHGTSIERVCSYELGEAELVKKGSARPGPHLGLLGGGRSDFGGEPPARPPLVDLKRGRGGYLM